MSQAKIHGFKDVLDEVSSEFSFRNAINAIVIEYDDKGDGLEVASL